MSSFFDAQALLTLLVLVCGGARDLTGFLSTDAYWKAKGIAISIGQLTRELEPVKAADVSTPIAELDADDPNTREAATNKILAVGPGALPALVETVKNGSPEASVRAAKLLVQIRAAYKPAYVRRLMAIRTLGEMKDPNAVAVLRPLLDSQEMFEAEYARSAIAMIEGKAHAPPVATEAERAADVFLLPSRLDMVFQAAPSIDGTFTFEKMIAQLPFEKVHKTKSRQEWIGKLVGILETAGNVRIDAITVGFYAAPPGVPGNYIVVARGEFDATAICALLRTITQKSEIVDGTNVFQIDTDAAVLVSSNRRLVFLGREAGGDLGINTMAAALKKGAGDLAGNADFQNLFKSIDRTAPVWLVANLTPGLKEVIGPLGNFDTVTIVASQSKDKDKLVADLSLVAVTSDRIRAQQGVAGFRGMLQNSVADGRREQELRPFIKPIVDFAESVKVDIDGGKMTAKGSLRDIPVLLFSTLPIQAENIALPPPGVPGR